MMETACRFRDMLSLRIDIRDEGPRHHLWMDCAKAKKNGVTFRTTMEGLAQCIEAYGLNM